MKKKIYLDTSIVSNYFDSRDAYLQMTTQIWWDSDMTQNAYHFVLSETTIDELLATKNESLRSQFLDFVEGIEILEPVNDVLKVAELYLKKEILSPKKLADALHVAYSTVHKIDYLVTWNISDLASPQRREKFKFLHSSLGLWIPELITPEFFEV